MTSSVQIAVNYVLAILLEYIYQNSSNVVLPTLAEWLARMAYVSQLRLI